jgi:hypothetical protein
VDTLGVVVLDVLPEQASQMVFAEHDHVVEKLPANAADEAFSGPSRTPARRRPVQLDRVTGFVKRLPRTSGSGGGRAGRRRRLAS